jgi:hypothetical protein
VLIFLKKLNIKCIYLPKVLKNSKFIINMKRENGMNKLSVAKKTNYILLTVLSVSLVGLMGIGRMGGGTLADDSAIIRNQGTDKDSQLRSVQGANSNDENSNCPEDKPIIGWIDYQGQKTIKYSLPEGELASACFATIEEAKEEGFIAQ